MKIGILSDTHDYLDPRIPQIFRGVDHIVHAGDVGRPWILLELEQTAPVTAVLGNMDTGLHLRETEVRQFGARRFLVHHIVNPEALSEGLRKRIDHVQPDVVVFGHTHKTFEKSVGNTLFLNPGYAGRPKFAQPRSVAVLHCGDRTLTSEIIPL